MGAVVVERAEGTGKQSEGRASGRSAGGSRSALRAPARWIAAIDPSLRAAFLATAATRGALAGIDAWWPGATDHWIAPNHPLPLGAALLRHLPESIAGFGGVWAGISTLAVFLAAWLSGRYLRVDALPDAAERAVWLVALLPGAAILHLSPTLATMSALVAATLLAARRDAWVIAAITAAIATMVAPGGALLSLPIAAEAARSGALRRAWTPWLALAAPIVTAAAWTAWTLGTIDTSALRFLHGATLSARPWETLVAWFEAGRTLPAIALGVWSLGLLLAALGLRSQRITTSVWALALLAILPMNPSARAFLGHVVACFPLAILLGRWMSERALPERALTVACSMALVIVYFTLGTGRVDF